MAMSKPSYTMFSLVIVSLIVIGIYIYIYNTQACFWWFVYRIVLILSWFWILRLIRIVYFTAVFLLFEALEYALMDIVRVRKKNLSAMLGNFYMTSNRDLWKKICFFFVSLLWSMIWIKCDNRWENNDSSS